MPISKFTTCLPLLLLISINSLFGQDGSDLVGTWLREDKQNYKVEIVGQDGVYNGKVLWMKKPLDENGDPRLDFQNPDPDLRDQPILGLRIFKDFKYGGDHNWNDGKIYHFTRGNEYRARIEMIQPDRIKLVISVWFFTRTYFWNRVKNSEQ